MKLGRVRGLISVIVLFIAVSSGVAKEDLKSQGNALLEKYPSKEEHLGFDRALLIKLGTFLQSKSLEEVARAKDVPDILFDGRVWDHKANSKHFKVLVRKHDKDLPLNKNGRYLLWKLPSTEHQQGRDRMVGLFWAGKGEPRIFYAQLSILNAER